MGQGHGDHFSSNHIDALGSDSHDFSLFSWTLDVTCVYLLTSLLEDIELFSKSSRPQLPELFCIYNILYV